MVSNNLTFNHVPPWLLAIFSLTILFAEVSDGCDAAPALPPLDAGECLRACNGFIEEVGRDSCRCKYENPNREEKQ